jgi:hypothetical protein
MFVLLLIINFCINPCVTFQISGENVPNLTANSTYDKVNIELVKLQNELYNQIQKDVYHERFSIKNIKINKAKAIKRSVRFQPPKSIVTELSKKFHSLGSKTNSKPNVNNKNNNKIAENYKKLKALSKNKKFLKKYKNELNKKLSQRTQIRPRICKRARVRCNKGKRIRTNQKSNIAKKTGSLTKKKFSNRRKESDGTYNTKNQERTRLINKFNPGFKIWSDHFQSEHIVGVKVVYGSTSLKRGEKGEATDLEKSAMAYFEINGFHRKHVGTQGSTSKADVDKYRQEISELMDKGDIKGAIIKNIQSYNKPDKIKINTNSNEEKSFAEKYDFNKETLEINDIEAKIADDSFKHMLLKSPAFEYYDSNNNKHTSNPLTENDKLEILEERYKAYNGGTIQNINDFKTKIINMWNKYKEENKKI